MGKRQRYRNCRDLVFRRGLEESSKKKKGPTQMEKSKLYRMKFDTFKAYQLPGKVRNNLNLSIGWQHDALKAESFKCHFLSSQPVCLRRLVPLGFSQCTS